MYISNLKEKFNILGNVNEFIKNTKKRNGIYKFFVESRNFLTIYLGSIISLYFILSLTTNIESDKLISSILGATFVTSLVVWSGFIAYFSYK
jgi:hypothetical protein